MPMRYRRSLIAKHKGSFITSLQLCRYADLPICDVGDQLKLYSQHLSGCEKVEVWPTQLAHQRSLKTLKLAGTNLKKELPGVIELPSDLEVLSIANPLLDTVMPSLEGLLNLKVLYLEYRREVKCLLERPSQLTCLKVAASPILHTSEVLSDEVEYPNLRGLILKECINVVEVGTLPKELRYVRLDRCYNLRSIEGLCGLPMLQTLYIEECINVVEIGKLPKALTFVRLERCYNLRSIQGLCGLPMLRELYIKKCNELQELPSVKTLVSLRSLYVADCENLNSIRDLAHQTELWSLTVWRCPELEKLEGVEYCTSLRSFSVGGVINCGWVKE